MEYADRNIAIGILALTTMSFTPSIFALSFSSGFSSDKANQPTQVAEASLPSANVSVSSDVVASSSEAQTQPIHTLHHPKYQHKKHDKKHHYRHRIGAPVQGSGAIVPASFAVTPGVSEHKWSVFGGLGWSNYLNGTSNKTFAVSSIETDQLTQDSGGSRVGYTLGFARNYDLSAKTNLLQSISIGGTFRYDPSILNGEVYQFQNSALNNYTYRYQIRPITQLVESDLLFKSVQKIHTSPFIVAGFGITEASLNYAETAQPGISGGANSGSNWVARPDVAIGAGLLWNIKNKKYFLKTQYLYQYRGNAHVNVSALNQGVPINLNEQSVDVLFGYRFK